LQGKFGEKADFCPKSVHSFEKLQEPKYPNLLRGVDRRPKSPRVHHVARIEPEPEMYSRATRGHNAASRLKAHFASVGRELPQQQNE